MYITYPHNWMALNAYYHVRECCERFNKEPVLNDPDDVAKIYAFGEIQTWGSYIKKLCLTAEKIGAKIQMKSIEETAELVSETRRKMWRETKRKQRANND